MIDLHTHTVFCDGNNTPEEMVLSAIEKGVKTLGIVAHSYLDFDVFYVMDYNKTEEFVSTVNSLKKKYADKIEILCGMEFDVLSKVDTGCFDYLIYSAHYIEKDGRIFAVDNTEEEFVKGVEKCFDGDYYKACERYFETIENIANEKNAYIVGHMDLIKKFNGNNKYFDTNDDRFIVPAKKAIDKLVEKGKIIEVNLGGIHRGLISEPYPALNLIEYIKQKGGKIILSSDAHSVNNVAYRFEEYAHLLD